MPKKASIIIPTFNKKELLHECIDSILENTDYEDIEIIVISNGCSDGTQELIKNYGFINLIEFKDPIGHTKAVNEGIKVSSSDYIVLLNNDTKILNYLPKNKWLDLLIDSLKDNVGICGPLVKYSQFSFNPFVVFFCACIKKEVINKIGLLDENFGLGYGDDIDFCSRAIKEGYKISSILGIEPSGYPIYHIGGETISDPNLKYSESIFKNNIKLLNKHRDYVKFNFFGKEYSEDCILVSINEEDDKIPYKYINEINKSIAVEVVIDKIPKIIMESGELNNLIENSFNLLKNNGILSIKNIVNFEIFNKKPTKNDILNKLKKNRFSNFNLTDENEYTYSLMAQKVVDYGGGSYNDFNAKIKQYLSSLPKDTRILDVGPGEGKYYNLLKDLYENIDCVEVYEKNISGNSLHEKYRNVFNKNIVDFKYDYYDLIIFGDVIEHLSIADATQVLNYAYEKCDNFIATIPYNYHQGPLYGNKYEIHIQQELNRWLIKKRYPMLKLLFNNERLGVYIKDKIYDKSSHTAPVTAVISTRNRAYSTLPITLRSIITQTLKPEEIIIFNDSDDSFYNDSLYINLFSEIDNAGIKLRLEKGEGKGQVHNHQKSIEISNNDLIWRLDDDTCPEDNVLSILYETIQKENAGAVGGIVCTPSDIKCIKEKDLNNKLYNKIDDVKTSPNIQWLFQDSSLKEVDHLYSSFLYKKSASKHGYCTLLSNVCHREETIFSYEMKRNGYKLLVNPNAITWHYRNPNGGIRDFDNEKLWEHDEKLFDTKVLLWDNIKPTDIVIHMNNGLGDHIAFAMILPELIEKHKDKRIWIGAAFEDIFKDYDVGLISVFQSLIYHNEKVDDYDIYKFMWDKDWKKPMVEAFRELYLGGAN